MRSRIYSMRITPEIWNLLNKVSLQTGKSKRKIIEEALLEFIKNHYKDVLSKDVNEILKESLEKSIKELPGEKKLENWRKEILNLIAYHRTKFNILYNRIHECSFEGMFGEVLNVQHLLELTNYEKALIRRCIKTFPEIDDMNTINFLIKFIDELTMLNKLVGDENEAYWSFYGFISERLRSLVDKPKENGELWKLLEKRSISETIRGIIDYQDSWRTYCSDCNDYFGRRLVIAYNHENGSKEEFYLMDFIYTILSAIEDSRISSQLKFLNKFYNLSFTTLYEYVRYIINLRKSRPNLESEISEAIETISEKVFNDFKRYLDEVFWNFKEGKIPSKTPIDFLETTIINYVKDLEFRDLVLRIDSILRELVNLDYPEEWLEKRKDIHNSLVKYIRQNYENKLEDKSTFYYLELSEEEMKKFVEDIKTIFGIKISNFTFP